MHVVCVHQGYELYGSDRAFIDSVMAVRKAWPCADIDVVLPREGPIVLSLLKYASRIAFEPLFVIRRRDVLKLMMLGVFWLVPALKRAVRRLRAADLVYVNTVVVFDYLLAARFFPGKVIVHVHEIPEGVALSFFRLLLTWSRAEIIFNSKATQRAFGLPEQHLQHVVYNGFAGPSETGGMHYDGSGPLRLLMIGRISRLKGQDVLIDALAALPKSIVQKIEVRIVGGAFGDHGRREAALRDKVCIAGLDTVVRFEPFCDDPGPLYAWADVVVVPSTTTESLGRVAIEALAHGRPALVSALGGLVEVVEDGVNGWLVPPNDAGALAVKITEIATNPGHWSGFSQAARLRYEAMFSRPVITRQLKQIVRARGAANEHTEATPDLAAI